MIALQNCINCQSDNIQVVSGVSFGVKCMDCFKIKVQCCDSREEAIEFWNRLKLNPKTK